MEPQGCLAFIAAKQGKTTCSFSEKSQVIVIVIVVVIVIVRVIVIVIAIVIVVVVVVVVVAVVVVRVRVTNHTHPGQEFKAVWDPGGPKSSKNGGGPNLDIGDCQNY